MNTTDRPVLKAKWLLLAAFLFGYCGVSYSQELLTKKTVVDVVWLRNGSKLSGKILRWDLSKGMEFRLITGAEIVIERKDIRRVAQDVPFEADSSPSLSALDRRLEFVRMERPYNFKEDGLYHTFSAFFNLSSLGGAGLHYSIGYRWNRLLSAGIGTGVETYDFIQNRDILPVYAEVRGFLLPEKFTPYYAIKAGYGFAMRNDRNFITEAHGGFHFSPEIGVRIGANAVSYYVGMEYKLQNATYTTTWWDGSSTTDQVSYRRIELRTGLIF